MSEPPSNRSADLTANPQNLEALKNDQGAGLPPTQDSNKKRCCVLASCNAESNSPFAQYDSYENTPQHWFPRDDPHYEFELHRIHKATAMQQVRSLAMSKKFDVFVNLCDGAWDEDRAGAEVVKALEYFNVPFTGGDSRFYEPSKQMMKMVAVYENIRTPAFVFAFSEDDIEEAVRTLKLPVIVKHYNGYSSVGLQKLSRCETEEGLRTEALRIITTFGGALIEEFIQGREATVLVAESFPGDRFSSESPRVHQVENGVVSFLPVECSFPPGESFKHFDIKWLDYDNMSWRPLPTEDTDLSQKLQKAARDIFRGLHGVSYGRADFRICSKTGDIYFLEINPNCGLFYPPGAFGSADHILSLDPAGPRGFAEHLINVAIHRQQKKFLATTCKVTYTPSKGYHLSAARALKEGELIQLNEGNAHYLTSRSYAEREWSAQHKDWFSRYAYPISDSVWVTWSPNPMDWRPINHSCDPNSWLSGNCEMNLVARRDIAKNEEITIDYATFCVDNMREFECRCGASTCRQTIRGTDYRDPAVRARYGTHVSAYIHSRLISPCSSVGEIAGDTSPPLTSVTGSGPSTSPMPTSPISSSEEDTHSSSCCSDGGSGRVRRESFARKTRFGPLSLAL